MRDMFYNYDYRIGHKDYTMDVRPERPEVLETNPNVQIVKNAFGKEVGVKAYHNSKFTLYFILEDRHGHELAEDAGLLTNNEAVFEIFDLHHELIYTTTFKTAGIINNCIEIELNSNETNTLPVGLYHMQLVLTNESSRQIIFYEDDSFLNII